MKKKNYMRPTMIIVRISNTKVVATSGGGQGSRSDYKGNDVQDWGDSGQNNAKSRGNDIWDEWSELIFDINYR